MAALPVLSPAKEKSAPCRTAADLEFESGNGSRWVNRFGLAEVAASRSSAGPPGMAVIPSSLVNARRTTAVTTRRHVSLSKLSEILCRFWGESLGRLW